MSIKNYFTKKRNTYLKVLQLRYCGRDSIIQVRNRSYFHYGPFGRTKNKMEVVQTYKTSRRYVTWRWYRHTGDVIDNWRQLEMLSITGDTLDNWRCSGQLEILWTTGGALDNLRYFGQLEVLSTTGDILDNRRCSRQLEVFSTGGTLDKWRCSRQLGVLWITEGALENKNLHPRVRVDQAVRPLPPKTLSILVGLILKLTSMCITIYKFRKVWTV